MGFGILGNGGIYDIYRAAVVERQIGIGTVIDGIIPVREEHYTLTAGHFEECGGKLTAVFEVGVETVVLAYALDKSAELFFNIAVKVEEISILQIGKAFNILIVYVGVEHSAAGVSKAADSEAVLDGRVEFVAYDYIKLACLKFGHKVGDRTALQTQIYGGEKPLEVLRYFVVKLGGIPSFGAAKPYGTAELGERSMYFGNKLIIVFKACFEEMVKSTSGGGGLQSAYLTL